MTGLRWWWVRHAPTGAEGAIGWTDLPADLSDRAALARLRALLPEGAARVASDLARARDTLAALGLEGARLPDAPALRELHFGAWERRRFEEIGEAARPLLEDPGAAAPPGGESWADLLARVSAFVLALSRDPPGPDIVAVAHAGTIRAALALALGLSGRSATGFRIAPLSLTRIDWLDPPGAFAVDRVNQRP